MKSNKKQKIIALLIFAITLTLSISARDYYQLKVYNLKDKSQESVVDKFLKDAYLPALHRAGIKHVGVFKPVDTSDGMKIIVFIPLKNIDQFEKLETSLAKDKNFQTDGSEYINASWENPPYERMESIILKAFSEMPEFAVPNHNTPPLERIYELRSYEGPTEKYYRKKVEMFNEGGEITIFNNVGSQPVFFGEVLSGSTMPNLMYLTTYSDMKSHDEHWNAFRTHPDWKELSAKEEYKHTVSKSVIQLLHPTEYSDL
ncbi:MAG: NIPSNAP family protein [Prolixibacteraceae bacterium]|nr:NIPSNAP family protein [Prolixibacteraceae bacterium]